MEFDTIKLFRYLFFSKINSCQKDSTLPDEIHKPESCVHRPHNEWMVTHTMMANSETLFLAERTRDSGWEINALLATFRF